MDEITDWIPFVIEALIILIIVILQLRYYRSVKNQINELNTFFPQVGGFTITTIPFNLTDVNDLEKIEEIASNPNPDSLGETTFEPKEHVIQLIQPADILKYENPEFFDVIRATNRYLLKNYGNAANFEILKNTCDRKVDLIEDRVASTINTPLFLGLIGTFLGIIFGLLALAFQNSWSDSVETLSTQGVNQLLQGVALAMSASLIGLVLTLLNSVKNLPKASYQTESSKNEYFDYLQRELLPYLNRDVSSGLASLRDVLNHFVGKFGDSLGDYKDSAKLLNQNLKEQKELLKEVNELDVLKVSTKIAQVFKDLKDSSESIAAYKKHVTQLNRAITNASKVVVNMKELTTDYKDFNKHLKLLSESVGNTLDLQVQLKDSLEKHFPVIDDHKVIWRKGIDELNNDISSAFSEMMEFSKKSLGMIEEFTSTNANFFVDKVRVSEVLVDMKSSYHQNVKTFESLSSAIQSLREHLNENQKNNLESHRLLIDEMKVLIDVSRAQNGQHEIVKDEDEQEEK